MFINGERRGQQDNVIKKKKGQQDNSMWIWCGTWLNREGGEKDNDHVRHVSLSDNVKCEQ